MCQTVVRSKHVERAKHSPVSSAGSVQRSPRRSLDPPLSTLRLRMRQYARPTCLVLACGLVLSTGAGRLSGQAAPPPEMKPWVLTDVGPIPAPSVCGCVTNPFTVTRPRPGYGYGSGPAAPDSDAPLTRVTARFQARRDAEDRTNLPGSVEDGLSGNGNASIGIAWLTSAGTAVDRDEQQATAWFLLAAEQGHPNAFAPLGHRYLRGLGVEQNDRAAAYWFQLGPPAGTRRR